MFVPSGFGSLISLVFGSLICLGCQSKITLIISAAFRRTLRIKLEAKCNVKSSDDCITKFQVVDGLDVTRMFVGDSIITITTLVAFIDKSSDAADAYEYINTGYIKTIKSLKLADGPAARLDRYLGF